MVLNKTDKGNNRGSTLIILVICTAFIMILSSIILSFIMTNRQMKRIDYDIKKNFYSAEMALDEIRAGLEEYVAASLEQAYVVILGGFTSYSNEEKRDIMKETLFDDLEASLSLGAGLYDIALLEGFLRSPASLNIAHGENLLIRDEDSMTLKNIRIEYEDDQGYLTSIATDIVISLPQAGSGPSYYHPEFSDYALIADRQVKLDGTGLVNGAMVRGSLYSGEGGILLANSRLEIGEALNIVTRGDIKVEANSVITVKDQSSIWVKNIYVNSDTAEDYELDIDGKCYVADDLTIDGKNSRVRVQGEYYGYSYESYNTKAASPLVTAKGSSAVLINGKNAGLEFMNMDALLISGRAFLSSDYVGDSDGVYTGESISVKELQLAYYVPKEYVWCGANPVSYEEYLAKPAATPEVDFGRSSVFPINVEEYADGFLSLHYIHRGERYKYYYLNFKSEAKANEYMQRLYEEFAKGSSDVTDIDELVGRNVESLILDDSISNIFLTAGNILTYSAYTSKLIDSPVDYGGPSLSAMEGLSRQLAKQYNSMTGDLKLISTSPLYDKASLFNSLIDRDVLDISPYETGYSVDADGETYYVYIINNPASTYYIDRIPPDERRGIIIASGSVCVNKSFQGLILAGEDIELKAAVNVSASREIIEAVLHAGNSDINRYFRGLASSSASGSDTADNIISVRDMIAFRNWRKNK